MTELSSSTGISVRVQVPPLSTQFVVMDVGNYLQSPAHVTPEKVSPKSLRHRLNMRSIWLEAVLKRDGTSVVTDAACASTSGKWVSPYDGVATTLASDLDIVSGIVTFPALFGLTNSCTVHLGSSCTP